MPVGQQQKMVTRIAGTSQVRIDGGGPGGQGPCGDWPYPGCCHCWPPQSGGWSCISAMTCAPRDSLATGSLEAKPIPSSARTPRLVASLLIGYSSQGKLS